MQKLITPALHAAAGAIRLLDKTDEKVSSDLASEKNWEAMKTILDTTIILLSEFPQWGVRMERRN